MSENKDFSYAMFALVTLGSAVIVLLGSGSLVMLLRPSPPVGLAIALAGVVGAIAVMGFVSTRYLKRTTGESERTPSVEPGQTHKPGNG